MYTGEDNPSKIGQISTWDHQNRTHFKGKCGEMRGSANGFFPPKVESDTLELFSHDACRVLSFYSMNETENVNGIDGTVYELPVTTFANTSVHEPNWCYENNLPSGVQNSSMCKDSNTPLMLSFPHFYGADQYYIRQFDSRSAFIPNKCDHGSKMVVMKVKNIVNLFFSILSKLSILSK